MNPLITEESKATEENFGRVSGGEPVARARMHRIGAQAICNTRISAPFSMVG